MRYTHIPIIAVVGLLFYAAAVVVVDWLSLPVVAFDYDGKCQWVQIATRHGLERVECPEVLPDRYDRIFVATINK